jgi:hypothetical protein
MFFLCGKLRTLSRYDVLFPEYDLYYWLQLMQENVLLMLIFEPLVYLSISSKHLLRCNQAFDHLEYAITENKWEKEK